MATPSPEAPLITPVVEPSAAEKLLSNFGALWRNLAGLDPAQLVLNLGLSILVLAAVAAATWGLRRLLRSGILHLTGKDRSSPPDADGLQETRLSWLLIRICLVAAALMLLLAIWGVDLLGWLTLSGVGAVLARIAGVLIVAVVLTELAGHMTVRLLRALSRRAKGRRTAQMNTLGPLIRGVIQGFIITVAGLTILSELGISIGPLLASAGVVGIALGFGAQTLVKDFLTGVFLILEDIVAVGDSVQIQDKAGTVEAMTLRTIRVRSFDGTLHVLPYSEAQVISNRTQTFSAYVFDLGVAYDTDVDHALAVMARVGEALQADPAFGPSILQPLEIVGLDRFDESALVLKARFRTRPGDQWRIGREFNKRIKRAFDAEGIQIPFPTRTLVVSPPSSSETLDEVGARPPPGRPPA